MFFFLLCKTRLSDYFIHPLLSAIMRTFLMLPYAYPFFMFLMLTSICLCFRTSLIKLCLLSFYVKQDFSSNSIDPLLSVSMRTF